MIKESNLTGTGVGLDLAASFSSQKISRRAFIKRVIAHGATVSASSFILSACSNGEDEAATAPPTITSTPAFTVQGSIERLISLNVNNKVRHVNVLPNETLAMTLRYKLGLTGIKLSYDRGECGACTVLLDDIPVYSCSTLTHTVRKKTAANL